MDNNHWPPIITFSLATLAYYRCSVEDKKRRCFPCLLKHRQSDPMCRLFENDVADESPVPPHESSETCSVCDDFKLSLQRPHNSTHEGRENIEVSEQTVLLGNSEINHFQYESTVGSTDKSPPPRQRSRVRSRLISALCLVYLGSVYALLINDWMFRILRNWGKIELLLYLLSYSTYLLPFIIIASMRIVAMCFEGRRPKHRWVYALTCQHIFTRIHPQKLSSVTRFGYVCAAFASVCVGFQIVYNSHLISIGCSRMGNIQILGMLVCFVGEFMFSSFCYLVYLLKRSVEADLKISLLFLKEHIATDLDSCRRRILEAFSDFLRLRSLISFWLIFQFSLSVFKLSCQIYWNYFVSNGNRGLTSVVLINVLIWLEIIMFLLLPPLAIGGFSIDYLWTDYKLLAKVMIREQNSNQWKKIIKFLKHLKPSVTSIYLTVLFSIVGVFSALHLGDQYAEYWFQDTICKATVTIDPNNVTGSSMGDSL